VIEVEGEGADYASAKAAVLAKVPADHRVLSYLAVRPSTATRPTLPGA